MQLVTSDTFDITLKLLSTKNILAIDLESTGLRWAHGSRLFSIIIADESEEYYFNFNDLNKTDHLNGVVPLSKELLPKFQALFDQKILWATANGKFDMNHLANEGLEIKGDVWDVLVIARLIDNSHMRYSLDACAERIGLKKLNTVEEWISKNRAFSWSTIPGKKSRQKDKHYWMVPLDIVAPYGCQDARVTYQLYKHQILELEKWAPIVKRNGKDIYKLVENEMKLTKVCFNMERVGFKLDVEYVKKALDYELSRVEKAKEDFLLHSGKALLDSNKALMESIGSEVEATKTEKGNASFTEDVLKKSDSPVAKALLEYRDANKRASTYYSSFLYHADRDGIIHCNIRQSATATGRFSISDPALQTLNSEEEGDYKVRNSFVAPSGYLLLSIDYSAMEFKAMVDTANEKELANKIANGFDPHDSTAAMVGISRKEAKVLNFMLLYGGGRHKLANSLNIPLDQATSIKNKYFRALPKVQEFINVANFKAKKDGYVINRFGRPLKLNVDYAYKAPNYLIQSGCADAMKLAMVQIDEYIRSNNLKSRLVLSVHDETIMYLHKNEMFVIEEIKKIMIKAWPERILPMSCSVEVSETGWGGLHEI